MLIIIYICMCVYIDTLQCQLSIYLQRFYGKVIIPVKITGIEVSLPLKLDPHILETAKLWFLPLERKIGNEETLKTMYHDFRKKYANLGHMSTAFQIFLTISYLINMYWNLNVQPQNIRLFLMFRVERHHEFRSTRYSWLDLPFKKNCMRLFSVFVSTNL